MNKRSAIPSDFETSERSSIVLLANSSSLFASM